MKKIVRLTTNGFTYEVDAVPIGMEGVVVKDISFRRDGYQGIFRGDNEEHYLIRIENALTEKDVIYKLIPANQMTELLFVEITEKEKKEDCETTTNDLTIANG
ncbi:hypothetical protein LCGC14_0969830 [marine sediment metagenome]|uniref:Uncharacterized protein n=1 Tax=marine sediment metagenome TaxID=412755 RepID=A0A0F9NGF3_9ZZZZ